MAYHQEKGMNLFKKASVGQVESLKRMSSGEEFEEYWVSWMFRPKHKITSYKTIIFFVFKLQ